MGGLCVVEVLDRPLPRPADASYVEARLLEALVETHLALRFLHEGLVRTPLVRHFKLGRHFWRLCYGWSLRG